MKIKSFYARTVEDAMALARSELGAEAMLVNSRKAPPDARALGEYEVVCAAEVGPEGGGASAASGPAAQAQPPDDRLSLEVADLKRELEGMRRALTRSAFAPSEWLAASPGLTEFYAALTANEVTPELAREIVQGAAGRMGIEGARRQEGGRLDRAVVEEIESRIAAEPHLGRAEGRPRIAALVGPPGCGKTTTLAKLAVNYGLAARRPVLLLSLDNYRVAAAEQLRSYAAIMGVGFQALDTVAALAQALGEGRGKDLILIDTPGLAFEDMDHGLPLARYLAGRGDIDTHLVLSSSMKPADLSRVVDSFEAFQPRRLIFTRLDETSSFGPIFNEAARTGKPLSFFGCGQRIPEDLETASKARVSEMVLTGRAMRARSAA